ncbi:MAG: pepT [Solirubrobacterales bacterium]|jgi:tripeptide aminopeptidase|nr:pepT [Solirubrobacterales bacterium]
MTACTSELAAALAPGLLERFVRYARVDTQSSTTSTERPSTPGQWDLARLLAEELRALGLEVEEADTGFVYGTLPATVEGADVIGLSAHLDVSPDAPGAGVEPVVHPNYDGGVLTLPRAGTTLDPERMPALRACVGHDLVTSSGDTLLGADDKAGIAEIVSAVAHLAAHPELPRPTIKVAFGPDEEIGDGATRFDVAGFGARCAYTLDGSTLGELQDETFSALQVVLRITGVDVHPGWAKGILVNAARLAGRIVAALPPELTPEATEGREGFLHVTGIEATGTQATVSLIARDFDDALLDGHVARVRRIAEEVVASEPRATLEVEVHEQYRNMRLHLEAVPEVSAAAEEAIRREGIEPVRTPIRGGTDGSILSARGLPTPNLFTGGHEYHSVREWASLQEMAAASAVVVHLAAVWAERARP